MLPQLFTKLRAILGSSQTQITSPELHIVGDAQRATMRILFVANARIPTLQLAFDEPLATLIQSGQVATALLTEQQLKQRFGKQLRSTEAWAWVKQLVAGFAPDVVVFCRYTGPHVAALLDETRRAGIASVFCIDDDLLNVPRELGAQKYEFHNHPLRIEACKVLLEKSDLVYCSNKVLRDRLITQVPAGHYLAGEMFCAGEVVSPAEMRPVTTLGYMGFDHAHDFELALPGLVAVMTAHPHLQFELFGKIPKPAALDPFGARVTVLPPVADYAHFMRALAERRWDIGICPLADTPFNRVKNINKWIEYTATGCATVASRGMIYDDCCDHGAGLLTDAGGWQAAIEALVTDPVLRHATVSAAQEKLRQDFSLSRLRLQVQDMLALARDRLPKQQESAA